MPALAFRSTPGFSLAALALATLGLVAPSAQAQSSFSGFDPNWNTLTSATPKATTGTAARNLQNNVISGTVDTRGTRVDVPNTTIETTSTGTRSVISDSLLRWHNPFGTTYPNPVSSRWYQKDGNTQVFRIFPNDQNWVGSRVGAGRSEAYAYNRTTVFSDNQTLTFSARFHVAQHNTSREVMLFQSKGRDENTNYRNDGGLRYPAWGLAMFVETDGDIVLIERNRVFANNVRVDTGFNVGQSFNLRVVDDGLNYSAYINNVLKASGSWQRGNTPTVARWGAYVQGGTNGILSGSVSQPCTVYVSGARVTKN